MVSLGDHLRGRDNALNFARLLLATGVVVSHTWPVGGYASNPHSFLRNLGGWSVACFFAISGFLIPASRQRLSLTAFAIRRGLRILPALWLCLVITAFAFVPIAAFLADVDYDLSGAAAYARDNATSLYLHPRVGEELNASPFPHTWNGSLWSLQWEVLCYAVVGLYVSRSPSRIRHVVPAAALVVVGGFAGGPFAYVLAYFGAGWLLHTFRDMVPLSFGISAACLIVTVAVVAASAPVTLAALPLAYLALAFGAACPIRWGLERDLSYGLYIFAFPVQQVLASAGLPRVGWGAYFAASMGVALLFAWGSWALVEAPALRLAHRWTSPTRSRADGRPRRVPTPS